jgi:hypothetical protein
MTTTHYCRVHGEYNVYDGNLGGCPDCQQLERDNIARLDDIAHANVKLAVQMVYHTNNPGDYECPACRMISLKYLASRCPLCRSDVNSTFWERIQAREEEERKDAERQHQTWLASPEYAKEQEEKKLAHEREFLAAKTAARRAKLVACVSTFAVNLLKGQVLLLGLLLAVATLCVPLVLDPAGRRLLVGGVCVGEVVVLYVCALRLRMAFRHSSVATH